MIIATYYLHISLIFLLPHKHLKNKDVTTSLATPPQHFLPKCLGCHGNHSCPGLTPLLHIISQCCYCCSRGRDIYLKKYIADVCQFRTMWIIWLTLELTLTLNSLNCSERLYLQYFLDYCLYRTLFNHISRIISLINQPII